VERDPEHTPREEEMYRALWRPRLWLGCHPVLLVMVGFACLFTVPIGMITHNLWWMLFGAILLAASMPLLRWLARIEPDFVEVIPRYRTYARHYGAIGSVGARFPDRRRHLR
jgi:type IV secretory pathway TrbD component